MSTEALLDDPPEAGLAWITLLLSSGLLGALIVWSLQNPSVLLPSLGAVGSSGLQTKNTVNASSTINASSTTSQPESELAQSTNVGDATHSATNVEQTSPTAQMDVAVAAQVSFDNLNEVEAVQPQAEELVDTPLEKLKRQELATLPGLAGRVRYEPQKSVPLEGSDQLLNRMFELLFLYIDSEVVVKISSGDFEDDDKNLELSKTRAQNLVGYLVDRGLDEQRFEIVPLGREQLPLGGHRVNVYAKDI